MSKKVLGNGAYSVALITKARKTGSRIRSSRGDAMNARLMHRADITEWIKEGSFNEKTNVVTDPRSVVVYGAGSYGSAIIALQSRLPASECKDLTGKVSNSKISIDWDGKVVEGRWADQDELFSVAVDKNSKLRGKLRTRTSPRPGVKKVNRETNPAVKFGNNLKTLQRVTGATPYGMPLAQAGMCIDSRWVTKNGFDVEEFRLVVGRETPQKQDYRDFRNATEIVKVAKKAKPRKVAKPKTEPVKAETTEGELVPA